MPAVGIFASVFEVLFGLGTVALYEAMAVQTWLLFYKAPPFEFKKMFGAPRLYNLPQALAVLFIGILPLLNNVNRWDSALSYNIYTGNVSHGQIRMHPDWRPVCLRNCRPL